MRIHVASDGLQSSGLYANVAEAIMASDNFISALARYESFEFEEPVRIILCS